MICNIIHGSNVKHLLNLVWMTMDVTSNINAAIFRYTVHCIDHGDQKCIILLQPCRLQKFMCNSVLLLPCHLGELLLLWQLQLQMFQSLASARKCILCCALLDAGRSKTVESVDYDIDLTLNINWDVSTRTLVLRSEVHSLSLWTNLPVPAIRV